jgi:hypothetical protein
MKIIALVSLGVLITFIAIQWATIRDHLEAWYCQLSIDTRTIDPEPGLKGLAASISGGNVIRVRPSDMFDFLANYTGVPVIVNAELDKASTYDMWLWHDTEVAAGNGGISFEVTAEQVVKCLKANGFRLTQQLLPKAAYVILGRPARLENPSAYVRNFDHEWWASH